MLRTMAAAYEIGQLRGDALHPAQLMWLATEGSAQALKASGAIGHLGAGAFADITVLDLRKVNNAVSDFFVICSGTSDTQIQSIAESIEKEVFLLNKEDPWHKEGLNNKSWVLIDYVNVVAHIFKKDEREYYNLESLWGDAEVETFEDL